MKTVIKFCTHASVAVLLVTSVPAEAGFLKDLFMPKAAAGAGKGKATENVQKKLPTTIRPAKAAPKAGGQVPNLAPVPEVAAPGATSLGGSFAPRLAAAQSKGRVVENTPAAKPAAKDTLLVGVVKGFVLVADPKQIRAGGRSEQGVVASGLDVGLPEAAKASLQASIGKPLTMNGLQALNNGVVKAYREAGIQVASVATPEQDITNGTVQLLVVLGRMGNLSVEGNKYFPTAVYKDNFTTKPGEILSTGKVVEDLRYLNRNTFRKVDMVYSPGPAYGQTDVVLQATEAKPQTFYAGMENTGNAGSAGNKKPFGDNRAIIGMQFGNLFNKDHQLNYQYTTNTEDGKLNAHSMDYRIPLKNRQEVRFQGAYSNYDGKVQGGAVTTKGSNSTAGLHYYRQVPRLGDFAGDLHLGVEQKRSNGDTLLGGVNAQKENSKYTQAIIGWAGEKIGISAHTRANVDAVGAVSGNIDNGITLPTKAKHSYLEAGLDQRYDFKDGTRLLVTARGQATNDGLPSTEEFYLGGRGSVRGWKQGTERVDSGAILNVTYQGNDLLGRKYTGSDLRPYAFLDGGVGQLEGKNKVAGATSKEMASAGVGFSYQYGRNVNLDLSYGHRIHEKGLTSDGKKGEAHGSLIVHY